MKLVTFAEDRIERFGFVIKHPATSELWVFDPEKAETQISLYASKPTSPYEASQPVFLKNRPWPQDMVSFLNLGEVGMSALRHLQDFLLRFLEQSDQAMLLGAGFPLRQVQLRAPIPRPRVYFGLVQNSATHWRNDPSRVILNIYPQGHARPQGAVVGPGQPVWIPPNTPRFGWNPELGVVIGRGGRYIDVNRAWEHIAGLTVVLDCSIPQYGMRFSAEAPDAKDWFAEASASWLGKKSDTLGPMGPYLTTLDSSSEKPRCSCST